MADSASERMAQLEKRVEALLALCQRLEEENRMLQSSQEHLNSERASLLDKNETARSRIEAMITRLKAMEHQ